MAKHLPPQKKEGLKGPIVGVGGFPINNLCCKNWIRGHKKLPYFVEIV